MTNDENVPMNPVSSSTRVIPLDHYREFQEIRDVSEFIQHPADEVLGTETNNHESIDLLRIPSRSKTKDNATLPWESDLSDYGIEYDKPASFQDPLYEFWTEHFAKDHKLRELYLRPKLSPIFFDEELNSLNDQLESKLNMWDYLQRKIQYYSKVFNSSLRD
ncbi:MAG: hypothetical protein QE271_08045 [Bacteriovoracaceae bacterium]|nr:hypothetical protein [Bacteriovoracaceae bacterium]